MATYTDNYQLTKPTYAEQADIGVINSNMNIIDDIMHSSQVSLAPAYDQSQTYAEGDVVMYELLMYKCISPTTGVWDGSKWERTTASESGGGGSAELDILGEASGAVASFADGASAGLAKCIAEIVPKQAGSGTPSPDNVRPISGSTSVTVTISDGETSTTKTTPLGQTVYGGLLNVLTGELTIDRVYLKLTSDLFTAFNNTLKAGFTDGDYLGQHIVACNALAPSYSYSTATDTTSVRTQDGRIIVVPSWASECTDLASFKTAYANQTELEVVHTITPQTIQLTPQEVNSLLGQNNISADTGDIDIVYVKASAPIQPNPTGTPTATLKKLGIEGMVFEVPSGGGGSSSEVIYSTTERVIGTFEDENGIIKPLYQKMVRFTNVANNGNIPFGVNGGENYMLITGRLSDTMPLPYIHGSAPSNNIGGFFNGDAWSLRSGNDAPSTVTGFMIIQYTKITD